MASPNFIQNEWWGEAYITTSYTQSLVNNVWTLVEPPTFTTNGNNKGFSVPANGRIQNDTGEDLECQVQTAWTVADSLSGGANLMWRYRTYDGVVWSDLSNEVEQWRSGASTNDLQDFTSQIITIQDGHSVGLWIISNAGDADIFRLNMNVRPT